MSDSRKKMLEKVKAILAKTMANGCTEEEAMAALNKARELMATYEIDESELAQFEQEKASIHRTKETDPYNIKVGLCQAVAKFTRCKGWGGKIDPISFVGLESDVIFATWLLDTLQRYVMRALREYQQKRAKLRIPNSNLMSASFVIGCVERIKEKLKALTVEIPAKNKEIIAAELKKNGIVLRKFTKDYAADPHGVKMGRAAGEHARFDKPVSQGGTRLLK